jgi:ferritin-like metal-binding protein YciE
LSRISKKPANRSPGWSGCSQLSGADAKTEGNDILDELTSAAKDMIGDIDASNLREAALIVSGNSNTKRWPPSLVACAQQLDFQEASSRLQQILDEEKAADAKLAQLAETVINPSRGQNAVHPERNIDLK